MYLGNSGNGLTTDRSASSKKPNPQGAPPKKNVPSALRPKGVTNTPSRPSTQTSRPKELDSIQIGVPGNIKPSYATFDAPVAVPQLLDRGTSMSFEANLQQTRPLPRQGIVYCVIHSQRNGFSRFQLPVRNGELPQKLRGVVPQFTPTSGPFKMFLVLVDENNEVSYLTSKDILESLISIPIFGRQANTNENQLSICSCLTGFRNVDYRSTSNPENGHYFYRNGSCW